MAKFDLEAPFDQLIGKISRKSEIIYRRTRRYDAGGHLKSETKHAYSQEDKRDFEKTPPRGEEKRNIEMIREAQHLTKQLFASDAAELKALRERFDRQLETGTPDTDAPVLKKTGKRKVYTQFDRFVYALIYNRLRQQADNNE